MFRKTVFLRSGKVAIDHKFYFYYIFLFNQTGERERDMNKYLIFIIRAIFSGVFAVVISRIFKPDTGVPYIAGLAIFLLAASYGMEYYRKKKTEK